MTGSNTPRRLWAQNVSLGGAFIRTAEPLPVGSRVRLSFSTPDQKIVQLGEARVCWRRSVGTVPEPSGFGVQFVDLDETAQRFLQELVKKSPTSLSGAGRRLAAQVEPPLRAPGYRPPLVPPPPSVPLEAELADEPSGAKIIPLHKVG